MALSNVSNERSTLSCVYGDSCVRICDYVYLLAPRRIEKNRNDHAQSWTSQLMDVYLVTGDLMPIIALTASAFTHVTYLCA